MLNCETPVEIFEPPPLILDGPESAEEPEKEDLEEDALAIDPFPGLNHPAAWWNIMYKEEVRACVATASKVVEDFSPRTRRREKILLRLYEGKHATLQFAAFVAFVLLSANDTIVKAMSKRRLDGEHAPRDFPYAFSSVLLVASALSVTAGSLLALVLEGPVGFQRCWAWRSLLRMTPISVLFQFATVLKFASLKYLPPDMVSVISQMQLVTLAVAMRLVLGMRYRISQWIALLLTSLAMVQYLSIRDGRHKNSVNDSPLQLSPNVTMGLTVLVVMCAIETLASVLAERVFKEKQGRHGEAFYTQKVHIDSSGLLFAALWCYVLEPFVLKDVDWFCKPHRCRQVIDKGLFDGWDRWTVIVLGVAVLKMWLSCMVVKVLDSVVKQLGSCMGVVLVYMEVLWIWPHKNRLDFETAVALAVVVMAVASFACSTRDSKMIDRLIMPQESQQPPPLPSVVKGEAWVSGYGALSK